MSARIALTARIQHYLAERRRLGFELRSPGLALASFARYVALVRHRGPLTAEVMADWARQVRGGDRGAAARRLMVLRPFARWLQQFESRTEVPDEPVFGPEPGRVTPHIYQDDEIVQLLAAAEALSPARSLRSVTYQTLFGLLASSGLRISEALAAAGWRRGLEVRRPDDPANQVCKVALGAGASHHRAGAGALSAIAQRAGADGSG